MVNFGLNSASILGICLAVAGAALYFLRSVRPELSRDHDIFFAAVGLLCGFILLFQGWRLDPILQFGQLLLTGATVFFAVESIRLRGVATEQAKRNTPIVDEERPVSRVYRTVAELDEIEPVYEEEPPMRRQIRGTRDARSTTTEEYYDEAPRRSSNRSSSGQRLGQGNKQRRRPSRPVTRSTERFEEDEWGSPNRSDDDDWDTSDRVSKSPRPTSNGSSRAESRRSDVASKPRKRSRPPQDSVNQRQQDVEATSTEYVDYQPVDRPDEESDNSANFDER